MSKHFCAALLAAAVLCVEARAESIEPWTKTFTSSTGDISSIIVRPEGGYYASISLQGGNCALWFDENGKPGGQYCFKDRSDNMIAAHGGGFLQYGVSDDRTEPVVTRPLAVKW